MATITMIGPKSLDAATIDAVKCTKAIYVLTDKTKAVKRIGRTDGDFAERVKSYIGNPQFPGLTLFWFQRASTKREAFELECLAYHKWSPPMNDTHPERPDGLNTACPDETCSVLDT